MRENQKLFETFREESRIFHFPYIMIKRAYPREICIGMDGLTCFIGHLRYILRMVERTRGNLHESVERRSIGK